MRRRFFHYLAVWGCSLFFLALLWVAFAPHPLKATPATHYVARDAACGVGITPCYGSMQEAVDAANSGDEIRVAAGNYTDVNVQIVGSTPITQVVYLSKTLSLRGGYTVTNWMTSYPSTQVTTLDAQGQGTVVYLTECITPTVDGFRITGGSSGVFAVHIAKLNLTNNTIISNGRGVTILYSSPAVIENNTISYNTTEENGGGIYLENTRYSIIKDNTFSHNTAVGEGGGAYLANSDDGTVENNQFINNQSQDDGGGVSLMGSDVLFVNNTLSGNLSGGGGGGLSVWGSAGAKIEHNDITSNTAKIGGGVFVSGILGVYVDSNLITSNQAQWYGGGVGLWTGVNATFINNVVTDNEAGYYGSGIYIGESHGEFIHNTIARNHGGDGTGVAVKNDPMAATTAMTLTNTIFADQAIGISVNDESTATVNGVLWSNTPLTISHTPAAAIFVANQFEGTANFDADGYHLMNGSAAIDQGILVAVQDDVDGQPRPVGILSDLGADELMPYVEIDQVNGATLCYTDTHGLLTSIELNPGSVNDLTKIEFVPVADLVIPDGFDFTERVFDLEAYRNGVHLPTLHFNIPVTVTMYYTATEVAGLDVDALQLYTWDGNVWLDAAYGSYVRNAEQHWLAVPICHLSRFALMVKSDLHTVYLPLVMRSP